MELWEWIAWSIVGILFSLYLLGTVGHALLNYPKSSDLREIEGTITRKCNPVESGGQIDILVGDITIIKSVSRSFFDSLSIGSRVIVEYGHGRINGKMIVFNIKKV